MLTPRIILLLMVISKTHWIFCDYTLAYPNVKFCCDRDSKFRFYEEFSCDNFDQDYIDNGGTIVSMNPMIIQSKPRVFVTGISGQIGRYIPDKFKDCIIYGLSRHALENDEIINFQYDIRDPILEDILCAVQPNIIINLASLIKADYMNKNPIETLEVNGVSHCKIYDIIHRNDLSCHLVNASTCEIYKGHINYVATEDDENYKPNNHYSIAKLMALQSSKYYRDCKNLRISNIIIFLTESRYRDNCFLMKKLSVHIQDWKFGNRYILKLGQIDNYRNILHSSDVAEAFKTVSEQEIYTDYLVCSDTVIKVSDVILNFYKYAGIELFKFENTYKTENEVCIEFNSFTRSLDYSINGKCTKLKALGWSQKMELEDIYKDLLS